MTKHASSILDLIGNTPLVHLRSASSDTGCTILGKAEFLNPGQSIKDRAALGMVEKARASGALRPGGIIVEGTAGNTGIGLAMIGAALGHEVVIVMPDNQAEEKKQAVRLHGAKLIEVPVAPPTSKEHFTHYSKQLADELDQNSPNGAWWADQFDNVDNQLTHYETTGPEIWQQTNGQLDGFVCAVGSGGSLGGISRYLKEQNNKIQIGIADPHGAKLYSWYTSGKLETDGSSITEGIGQGRITENLKNVAVDMAWRIGDQEAVSIVFDLIQQEGICLGSSSGVNIAGAIKMAIEMGPGNTIVTLLCDYGHRYASKLFNPEFLRDNDLPVPNWLEG